MDILYQDNRVFVCVKPFGVLSTDEDGGVPSLLRAQLGDEAACVRTVHRLDRVVGGVILLARSREAARRLSADIRERRFQKEYLAVVHGAPEPAGTFRDALHRDALTRKTFVAETDAPETQQAVLHYRVLQTAGDLSLVHVRPQTGRTHQIRAQLSAHGFPIVGDKKYGAPPLRENEIALWSFALTLRHPQTGETMRFQCLPPQHEPWRQFESNL